MDSYDELEAVCDAAVQKSIILQKRLAQLEAKVRQERAWSSDDELPKAIIAIHDQDQNVLPRMNSAPVASSTSKKNSVIEDPPKVSKARAKKLPKPAIETETLPSVAVPEGQSCVNHVFYEWLTEWSKEMAQVNSNVSSVYRRAATAIKNHSFPLFTGAQAVTIKGIGPSIASKLDKKIASTGIQLHPQLTEEHKCLYAPRTTTTEKVIRKSTSASSATIDSNSSGIQSVPSPSKAPPTKKSRASKYVPAINSGPYALLISLLLATTDAGTRDRRVSSGRTFLSKTEWIAKAQPFCKSSFTIVDPNGSSKFHTAWHSHKTLLEKELIFVSGQPARYALSEAGEKLARELWRASQTVNPPGSNNAEPGPSSSAMSASSHSYIARHDTIVLDDDSDPFESSPVVIGTTFVSDSRGLSQRTLNLNVLESQSVSSLPPPSIAQSQTTSLRTVASDNVVAWSPIVWPAGTYSIHLVLDTREIRGRTDRNYIKTHLQQLHQLPSETRALELGDALWLAKRLDQPAEEVVLDCIVERKRLDDLLSSVTDGRFVEQKNRLADCGLSRKIYIVENYNLPNQRIDNCFFGFIEAIQMATIVQDGLFLEKTQHLDDTIVYLAQLTQLIKDEYKNEDLYIYPSHIWTQTNREAVRDSAKQYFPSKRLHYSYPVFADLCNKTSNLTVRDTFTRMLCALNRVTWARATAITELYPTPDALLSFFSSLQFDPLLCCQHLSKLQFSDRKAKAFGIAAARSVYEFMCGPIPSGVFREPKKKAVKKTASDFGTDSDAHSVL